MKNLYKHLLNINKAQTMVDITNIIEEDIRSSNVRDSITVVYCPHTTASITINENADPDVVRDLIYGFEKAYQAMIIIIGILRAIPMHPKIFNIGASQTLIIDDGKHFRKMAGYLFCEFDGPRNRTFM